MKSPAGWSTSASATFGEDHDPAHEKRPGRAGTPWSLVEGKRVALIHRSGRESSGTSRSLDPTVLR